MKHVLSSILVSVVLPQLASPVPTANQANEDKVFTRQLSKFQVYHSSNATNPKVTITKSGDGEIATGYLIYGPDLGSATPVIMDNDGHLIWNAPSTLPGRNIRVQELNDEKLLTVFDTYYAYSNAGYLYGSVKILDNTYNVTQEICPKLDLYIPFTTDPVPCQADAHEQIITSDGTLIYTAYNVSQLDLTSVGGPKKGWVVDGQFYEVDIATGDILFSWKSNHHIPVNTSQWALNGGGKSPTSAWDYFHINSVQKVGNQYVVSGRHTWAAYLINSDGSVAWTFNGYNGGDFGPLPVTPTNMSGHIFAYQHHATLHQVEEDSVVLNLFNNNNYSPYLTVNPSNGYSFLLNTRNKTSKLLQDYRDPSHQVNSGMEGSIMKLPNGNTLVSYGDQPVVQEYGTNDTAPLMTMSFGTGPFGGSYRIYKSHWVGNPTTAPDVAVDAKKGFGYVSWNGATEVAKWVVKSGKTKKLTASIDVPKAGFESKFKLPAGSYLRVLAQNVKGEVIGSSEVVHIDQ